MELEENTNISIPAPFSNLPSILTGRSLIPLPPTIEEQQQQYNTSSNERTITSGPSSSSSSELPNLVPNAAPTLFLRIGSWQVCKRKLFEKAGTMWLLPSKETRSLRSQP